MRHIVSNLACNFFGWNELAYKAFHSYVLFTIVSLNQTKPQVRNIYTQCITNDDFSITDERKITNVTQRKHTKQTIGSFIPWISAYE